MRGMADDLIEAAACTDFRLAPLHSHIVAKLPSIDLKLLSIRIDTSYYLSTHTYTSSCYHSRIRPSAAVNPRVTLVCELSRQSLRRPCLIVVCILKLNLN